MPSKLTKARRNYKLVDETLEPTRTRAEQKQDEWLRETYPKPQYMVRVVRKLTMFRDKAGRMQTEVNFYVRAYERVR